MFASGAIQHLLIGHTFVTDRIVRDIHIPKSEIRPHVSLLEFQHVRKQYCFHGANPFSFLIVGYGEGSKPKVTRTGKPI